jgi:hypothetical protein
VTFSSFGVLAREIAGNLAKHLLEALGYSVLVWWQIAA